MTHIAKLPFALFKALYDFLARTPLRRVPGMLTLSNIIFRWTWRSDNIVDIQGFKMYINAFDPSPALRKTFQAYAMNRVHEEVTSELFRRFLKAGDVVLDLGANIGYFTMMAAHSVGPTGRVISFEPEPRNFWYLSKNAEVNNFGHLLLEQKAVSDRNGTLNLFVCDYDSGHHTINSVDGIRAIARGRAYKETAIEVGTVRVDDFLEASHIDRVDVIKMDLEGAEALALEGMRKTLSKNDVRVFAEYYPALLTSMGSDPEQYIKHLLEDFGFAMYAIANEYDLTHKKAGMLPIRSYRDLAEMLSGEHDHVNIFLTKCPSDADVQIHTSGSPGATPERGR